MFCFVITVSALRKKKKILLVFMKGSGEWSVVRKKS